MLNKIEIHTAKFVLASDVFSGCACVWDAFSDDSELDCTFGCNNHSLLSKQFMLVAIDNLDIDGGEDDSNNENAYEVVKSRLESLDDDVYIDLEN